MPKLKSKTRLTTILPRDAIKSYEVVPPELPTFEEIEASAPQPIYTPPQTYIGTPRDTRTPEQKERDAANFLIMLLNAQDAENWNAQPNLIRMWQDPVNVEQAAHDPRDLHRKQTNAVMIPTTVAATAPVALSYIAPGTAGGTFVGNMAGGMLFGSIADETSRAVTGRTLGENARDAIQLFTGFNGFTNPIYNFLYDVGTNVGANPLYLINPTRVWNTVTNAAKPLFIPVRNTLIARSIASGEPTEVIISAEPKMRYKLGDVEINDPNLNYRQGDELMVKDFVDNDVVRVKYPEVTSEEMIDLSLLPLADQIHLARKSFQEPMFKLGGLWYDPHAIEGAIPTEKGLLVTNEPLQFANQNARPIKVDKGGRRIPFSENQLNKTNTTAYIYEEGYGFRRVDQPEPITVFNEPENAFAAIDSKVRNPKGKTFDPTKTYPENSRTATEHVLADIERGILRVNDKGHVYFNYDVALPELTSDIQLLNNHPIGMLIDGEFFPNSAYNKFVNNVNRWYDINTVGYGVGTVKPDGDLMAYYNNIIKPLGENYLVPGVELNTELPIYFGPLKTPRAGLFSKEGGFGGINTSELITKNSNLKSILGHEFIHGTDAMYAPALKAYGKIAQMFKDFNDNIAKIPNGGSFKASEVRATFNELKMSLNTKSPKELQNAIDKLSDDEIVTMLYNTNGYGRDYGEILDYMKEVDPKAYEYTMRSIREALKYLPIAITPFIFTNK